MALVKVKMLTTGPNKNRKVGQVIEVDAARAAALIKGDHAEEVKYGDRVRIQERKDIQRSV